MLVCRTSIEGAVSTVCNTYVFVMRAWVVGCDKHFPQHIVRISAEAPNGYVVMYLYIPAKIPT